MIYRHYRDTRDSGMGSMCARSRGLLGARPLLHRVALISFATQNQSRTSSFVPVGYMNSASSHDSTFTRTTTDRPDLERSDEHLGTLG